MLCWLWLSGLLGHSPSPPGPRPRWMNALLSRAAPSGHVWLRLLAWQVVPEGTRPSRTCFLSCLFNSGLLLRGNVTLLHGCSSLLSSHWETELWLLRVINEFSSIPNWLCLVIPQSVPRWALHQRGFTTQSGCLSVAFTTQ